MSIPLVVNNKTFAYPSTGQDPGWGEDATRWAREVTRVLASLNGTNDILQTSFTIANNTSSATDINGLLFNTSQVRAATINYSLYRNTTGGGATELAESGVIQIVYKTVAATWELAQQSVGNAGVIFSITSGGQFQYTSSNMTGSSYTGKMVFTASTLAV